jgi:hypothetical protein
MLSSITPLGERGRGRRWGATVAAFTLGSVAGGAALGGLLALAGLLLATVARPPAPVVLGAAALAAAAGFVADLGPGGPGGPAGPGGRFALPTVRRQVNEDWLDTYRGWVVGVGFGAQLGAGLATIVTSAAVHLVFVLALLAGSVQTPAGPWAGLALGALFGLARALPLLAAGAATGPAGLSALHRRLERLAPTAHRLTIALLALAALALGAAAVAGT